MARQHLRLIAVIATFTLIAAACGKDRAASTPTTAAVPATSSSAPSGTDASTTTVPAGPTFGDAPWPCSAGTAANTDSGSEVGVTKDAISIATGDDAGFVASPGLDHEITDAMKALVSKCNDLGGINGRKIALNYYDAKIFEVPAAMQAACDAKNFFLVGEGWAFDSNQEEIRLGCKLPAVPTFAVSAAFAHGPDVYQAVPNPADETTAGVYPQIAKLFPDAVKKAATLAGNFSATQETRDKVVLAAAQFGWNFVSTKLEYNAGGETDWTPFVKQLQSAGAQIVDWAGTCLPGLQLFAQTAKTNGLSIQIVTDTNHYTPQCAAANTDGAMDNVYIRTAFVPFEDAAANKATQDYLDLMKEKGGDIAQLGAQATTTFLLWATAAQKCGAELTRACVLQNLKDTHSWTGHGLHAGGDPGANIPPKCGAVLRIQGTKYVRVVPAEAGKFECDDSWIAKTPTAAVTAAKLDANRISHQFGG